MKSAHQNRPGDRSQRHLAWMSLVETSGPVLSLPVLTETWPDLVALEDSGALRRAHSEWQRGPIGESTDRTWLDFLLRGLLGWGNDLRWDTTALKEMPVKTHDLQLRPDFVLVEPQEEPGPKMMRLLGLHIPGAHPAQRVKGEAWAASPIERVANLCRFHDVPLGLATDGRFIALVYAPMRKAAASIVFDTVTWNESGDRDVVRAWISLLERRRFFAVRDAELLPNLFERSEGDGEDITEALGKQARLAVEYLVESIGRADRLARARGESGITDVDAAEIYRCAVSVMMRVVFLLFAEEKGLLPAGKELFDRAYSTRGLYKELKAAADAESEDLLETRYDGWLRLLALFTAVKKGISHPELKLTAYNGSMFDPAEFPWMHDEAKPLLVDNRTVLQMLRSVMSVSIGSGRAKETRNLSFKRLDVEQIGYVYEGLLSFVGRRAEETTLGLTGKQGLEDEVPLSVLEDLRRRHHEPGELAAVLAEKYKGSRLGTPRAIEAKLRSVDERKARRALLAATERDVELTERLIPWFGLIRTDLRGLPMVFLPGALFMTESALRKNTGTHYTPRRLAEEVVEGALQPLLYSVGPLQTADESEWVPVGSAEILKLKVADIAMGSGAFLVAACRYLADALVEAWEREESPEVVHREWDGWSVLDEDSDPTLMKARRMVAERCLYGVDINPMAVEMAKLSLWLVSMDPARPFTFLDDRLIAGDSLLGITDVDQIRYMHMDPKAGRVLHAGVKLDEADFAKALWELIDATAAMRRELAEMPGDTAEQVAAKAARLREVRAATERTKAYADLVVGAALAGAGKSAAAANDLYVKAAEIAAKPDGEEATIIRAWLRTDQPSGAFDRIPVHWPLESPEVFADREGGFDAVIGNPPFLGGQKLTGAMGDTYREHLVKGLGRGRRGSADLVAYFLLQAHKLLSERGQTALIATNTLAQGDTREVGLDQVTADGVTIRGAIKSEPWPSKSAVLEYCAVWTSRAEAAPTAARKLDGRAVKEISTTLDPRSALNWVPKRLIANADLSYIGSYILGMGFTVGPGRARDLIKQDPTNEDVLFPYLSGQDLNSRPDGSASRWVINFHDWPEEKASQYPDCFDQVAQKVRPERAGKSFSKHARERWWQYERGRPELYRAIKGLVQTIAIARVSKTAMPVFVTTGQVLNEKIVVFARNDAALLSLLSGAAHYWWGTTYSSTRTGDLNYAPTDVFETLVRPELTDELRRLGERLDSERREYMLGEQKGLTATYNLVHDSGCSTAGIANLREIHRLIDFEVCRAYGWDDLVDSLNHGHHDTRQGIRYTVDAVAQREILDRLLLLNKERYEEEMAQGLHKPKKAPKGPKKLDGPALFD